MIEREPRLKERIVTFTFVCERDREQEAREALRQIKGVVLSDEPIIHHKGPYGLILSTEPPIQMSIHVDPETGETSLREGIEITGLAIKENFSQVVRALAEAKIAGCSRSSQINVQSLEDAGKKIRQSTEIEFDEEGLGVSIGLSGEREDLPAEITTVFRVQLGVERYIGLAEVPRWVLAEVTSELKVRLSRETYNEQECSLINLAIAQLEDLLVSKN